MEKLLSIKSQPQQTRFTNVLSGKLPFSNEAVRDNRGTTVWQRQLVATIQNSQQAIAQRHTSQKMHSSPRMQAQRRIFSGISDQAIQRQVLSTGALDNRQTDVTWATGQIQGDGTNTTVGVKRSQILWVPIICKAAHLNPGHKKA